MKYKSPFTKTVARNHMDAETDPNPAPAFRPMPTLTAREPLAARLERSQTAATLFQTSHTVGSRPAPPVNKVLCLIKESTKKPVIALHA